MVGQTYRGGTFAGTLALAAFAIGPGCGGEKNYYFYAGGAGGVPASDGGGVGGSSSFAAGAGAVPAGGSGLGGAAAGSGGVPPGGAPNAGAPNAGAPNAGAPNAGAPNGGSGGAVVGPTRLGQACASDIECDPGGTTGLTCVTATSTELAGGAPPRGVCTLKCGSNETCQGVHPDAVCTTFDALGDAAYCMEGCILGDAGPLQATPKCHNRSEFACTPLDAISTGTPCDGPGTCAAGLHCFGGECISLISACMPVCTGDQDCSGGLFCDRAEGTCKPESTAGEPLGAACDPAAAADPCSGFCQSVTDVPNLDGLCAEACNFAGPCAWEAGEPTGLCAFSSAVNDRPELGDLGFCAQFCDCSAQCRTPGFGCVPIPEFEEAFGWAGLCLYPFDENGTPSETLDCSGSGFACEGDIVIPYPSCDPGGAPSPCDACIQANCCDLWRECVATDSTAGDFVCGWGGPYGNGEIGCIVQCMVDGAADPSDCGHCAASQWQPAPQCLDEPLVTQVTADLVGCMVDEGCDIECFLE